MNDLHVGHAIELLKRASEHPYWDGGATIDNKEEVHKLISESIELLNTCSELFRAIECARISDSQGKMLSYIDVAEGILKTIDPSYSLWTECSKGLPPEGMECLIRYYNSSTCENLTDIAWIDRDGEWQFIRENGGYFPYDFKNNVTHWMPSLGGDGWPRR